MKKNVIKLNWDYPLPTINYKLGFTVIELLVVISIIAILTTAVTINFKAQREQQELLASSSDVISRLREVQSNLLAGKVIPGGTVSAKAYQINFTASGSTFDILYNTGSATTTLETVKLSKNIAVKQVLVGGTAQSPVSVYLRAPFGKMTVVGTGTNQILQIDLEHQKSSAVRSVIMDGISGRVGLK